MPLPADGTFAAHNAAVLSKLRSQTTKHAGFVEYVKSVVADGLAVADSTEMTVDEKIQQFKNAGAALLATTEEAWKAIAYNTEKDTE